MAQIPGFEYDIFISCTHDDNHSPTDAPGWVDRFQDALESWLKHRRGFSDLTIWRDKALDGNTDMKSGDAPLQNLARALLSVLGESIDTEALEIFAETIRRSGARAVLEKTLPALDTRDANLLLLVDQFEELFRFQRERDGGQDEAADFVSILLRLTEQNEAPFFISLTMRSDFLGDCDAFQGLPEAINRSQYLVPRLTRQQRREAVAGPPQ